MSHVVCIVPGCGHPQQSSNGPFPGGQNGRVGLSRNTGTTGSGSGQTELQRRLAAQRALAAVGAVGGGIAGGHNQNRIDQLQAGQSSQGQRVSSSNTTTTTSQQGQQSTGTTGSGSGSGQTELQRRLAAQRALAAVGAVGGGIAGGHNQNRIDQLRAGQSSQGQRVSSSSTTTTTSQQGQQSTGQGTYTNTGNRPSSQTGHTQQGSQGGTTGTGQTICGIVGPCWTAGSGSSQGQGASQSSQQGQQGNTQQASQASQGSGFQWAQAGGGGDRVYASAQAGQASQAGGIQVAADGLGSGFASSNTGGYGGNYTGPHAGGAFPVGTLQGAPPPKHPVYGYGNKETHAAHEQLMGQARKNRDARVAQEGIDNYNVTMIPGDGGVGIDPTTGLPLGNDPATGLSYGAPAGPGPNPVQQQKIKEGVKTGLNAVGGAVNAVAEAIGGAMRRKPPASMPVESPAPSAPVPGASSIYNPTVRAELETHAKISSEGYDDILSRVTSQPGFNDPNYMTAGAAGAPSAPAVGTEVIDAMIPSVPASLDFPTESKPTHETGYGEELEGFGEEMVVGEEIVSGEETGGFGAEIDPADFESFGEGWEGFEEATGGDTPKETPKPIPPLNVPAPNTDLKPVGQPQRDPNPVGTNGRRLLPSTLDPATVTLQSESWIDHLTVGGVSVGRVLFPEVLRAGTTTGTVTKPNMPLPETPMPNQTGSTSVESANVDAPGPNVPGFGGYLEGIESGEFTGIPQQETIGQSMPNPSPIGQPSPGQNYPSERLHHPSEEEAELAETGAAIEQGLAAGNARPEWTHPTYYPGQLGVYDPESGIEFTQFPSSEPWQDPESGQWYGGENEIDPVTGLTFLEYHLNPPVGVPGNVPPVDEIPMPELGGPDPVPYVPTEFNEQAPIYVEGEAFVPARTRVETEFLEVERFRQNLEEIRQRRQRLETLRQELESPVHWTGLPRERPHSLEERRELREIGRELLEMGRMEAEALESVSRNERELNEAQAELVRQEHAHHERVQEQLRVWHEEQERVRLSERRGNEQRNALIRVRNRQNEAQRLERQRQIEEVNRIGERARNPEAFWREHRGRIERVAEMAQHESLENLKPQEQYSELVGYLRQQGVTSPEEINRIIQMSGFGGRRVAIEEGSNRGGSYQLSPEAIQELLQGFNGTYEEFMTHLRENGRGPAAEFFAAAGRGAWGAVMKPVRFVGGTVMMGGRLTYNTLEGGVDLTTSLWPGGRTPMEGLESFYENTIKDGIPGLGVDIIKAAGELPNRLLNGLLTIDPVTGEPTGLNLFGVIEAGIAIASGGGGLMAAEAFVNGLLVRQSGMGEGANASELNFEQIMAAIRGGSGESAIEGGISGLGNSLNAMIEGNLSLIPGVTWENGRLTVHENTLINFLGERGGAAATTPVVNAAVQRIIDRITGANEGDNRNCCFMPGTKIRLPDGTDKNIEDIQIGDEVSCYNLDDGKSEHTRVESLLNDGEPWYRYEHYILKFDDSTEELKLSDDHPIYGKTAEGDIGWLCINKEMSDRGYPGIPKTEVKVNDEIYVPETNEFKKINSIVEVLETHQMYTFGTSSENHNYIANGFLARNRGTNTGNPGGGRGGGGECGSGGRNPSNGDGTPIDDGTGGCFVAGTKISMADGTEKNIEAVVVGDTVKAFDTDTDKVIDSLVSTVFVHPDTKGYYIINNNLNVTGNHPMWVDGGWKQVEDIVVTDELQHIDGSKVTVDAIKQVDDVVETYNFKVENVHNYYANNVLAHNKSLPPPWAGTGMTEQQWRTQHGLPTINTRNTTTVTPVVTPTNTNNRGTNVNPTVTPVVTPTNNNSTINTRNTTNVTPVGNQNVSNSVPGGNSGPYIPTGPGGNSGPYIPTGPGGGSSSGSFGGGGSTPGSTAVGGGGTNPTPSTGSGGSSVGGRGVPGSSSGSSGSSSGSSSRGSTLPNGVVIGGRSSGGR